MNELVAVKELYLPPVLRSILSRKDVDPFEN